MAWIMLFIAALSAILVVFAIWTAIVARQAEAKYPPLGKFVSVDGCRLHYIEQGSGPPVILLHGDSGTTWDFRLSPLMDILAMDHHVLAFDRPGLGYSQRPRSGSSPFTQARLIHGAVRELGLQRPVLVGHSRGGPVCLAYAVAYPDDLTGVVNVAGGSYYQGGGGSVFSLLTIPVVGRLLAHTVAVPFGRGFVKMTMNMAFSPDRTPPPDFLDAFASMELRPGQLMASADDIVNSPAGMRDLMRRYGEIRVPVVSVHGAADRNVDVRSSRRLVNDIRGSRLIEVEDSGHEVMVNHPEAIARGVHEVMQMAAASR